MPVCAPRFIATTMTLLAGMVLAGCTTTKNTVAPKAQTTSRDVETPQDVASVVKRKMPANIKDREGWAQDIATTFASQSIAPTQENICAVLAIAQQESDFQADPVVPGLSKMARKEIDRRAARLHIPASQVRTALKMTSPNGKSYGERLDRVSTQKQLSDIFDDFMASVPLGQKLFGSLNPVRTGGAMQISVAFAEKHTNGYPWKMEGTVRQEVFTRRGSLWFGTYHLLNYPANYTASISRFADFNAGLYTSRNAAFQHAVSKATGVPLTLDGGLILYGSGEASETELAIRKLGAKLDMSDRDIRRQLQAGDSLRLEKTALYQNVYRLAEQKSGETLPKEILPGISMENPTITRDLTTAWFAKRVDDRRALCLSKN